MTGTTMSATKLLDYVRRALTNRSQVYIRAGFVHESMARHLPGRAAIRIDCDYSLFPSSHNFVTVHIGNHGIIRATYYEHSSHLLCNMGNNTPGWEFWLKWVTAAMPMGLHRAAPGWYHVGFRYNMAPALRDAIIRVVRRRFPQAQPV